MMETKRGKSITFMMARQLQLWRKRGRERGRGMFPNIKNSKHLNCLDQFPLTSETYSMIISYVNCINAINTWNG